MIVHGGGREVEERMKRGISIEFTLFSFAYSFFVISSLQLNPVIAIKLIKDEV